MTEDNIPVMFIQKYNIFTFMLEKELINFHDVYDDSCEIDDIEFYLFEKFLMISKIDLNDEKLDIESIFENNDIDENIIDLSLEFVDFISKKNIIDVDDIIKNISNENSELFS